MAESNQSQQVDVNALAAKVSGSASGEPEAKAFGEIPVDKFNGALKEAVGIEDYRQISELKQWPAKYAELERSFKDAQAKLAQNPYPNQFVEKLAEMYRSGADDTMVSRFIQVQSLDFKNPDEVIRMKIAMDNPRFTTEMIDNEFEEMFGRIPDKDDDQYEHLMNRRKMKIEKEAIRAEEELKKHVTSTENPEAKKLQEEEAKRREVLSQQWNVVTESMINHTNKIKISLGEKAVGGEYHFEFAPPKDDQQKIQAALVNAAISQGIPLDESGVQKLMEVQQQILKAMYFDQFMEHMARDLYASVTEAVVKKSVLPTQPVKQTAPPQPKQKKSPFPGVTTGVGKEKMI